MAATFSEPFRFSILLHSIHPTAAVNTETLSLTIGMSSVSRLEPNQCWVSNECPFLNLEIADAFKGFCSFRNAAFSRKTETAATRLGRRKNISEENSSKFQSHACYLLLVGFLVSLSPFFINCQFACTRGSNSASANSSMTYSYHHCRNYVGSACVNCNIN